MEHLDIIIYALIAVVLLARLWSVFGRRNEEDKQRPNPFVTPAPGLRDEEDVVVQPGRGRNPLPPMLSVAPLSLLGALEAVKKLDPSFDEKEFLQKARTIFSSIIDAFAKGDLSPVRPLLGPAVLPHFEGAIAARNAAGESLSCRVARMRDVETAAARIENTCVFVAVRFISEQENILRDRAGKIVSGAEGKTEEITDLWTFARDTGVSGADWQLVETKS